MFLRKLFSKPVSFEDYIKAAETGEIKTVNQFIKENPAKLLDTGLTDQQVEETGDTALIIAVRHHQHEVVEALMTKPWCDLKNDNGQTAIMTAAMVGCDHCVNQLIHTNHKHLSTTDKRDNDGNSALMHAIQNGHASTALRLLEPDAGSTLDRVNENGDSILMMAVRHKLVPVVLKLKELGAEISIRNKAQETAAILALKDEALRDIYPISYREFLEAVIFGELAVVQKVLEVHPEWTRINPISDTIKNSLEIPFIHAAQNGYLAVVQALLAVPGFDINHQLKGGSALTRAAMVGHTGIVQALLARPDIALDDVAFAAKKAMMHNKYDCFKVLIEKPGIDFSKENQDGQAEPIFILAACHNDSRYFTDLLARADINFNVKCNSGGTALIYASDFKHFDRVEALLAKPGIQINETTPQGVTVLMAAIYGRGNTREPIARKLIEAKADVNRTISNGTNALMVAISQGHFRVADRLLKAGADTTMVNGDNQTALSLCAPLKFKNESKEFNTFFKKLRVTHARQTLALAESPDSPLAQKDGSNDAAQAPSSPKI